jgi:hypothetical protein
MSDADSPTPELRTPTPPRRSFLTGLAALAATAPLVGWRWSRQAPIPAAGTSTAPPQQPNATTLDALGQAVLPSDLGPDGTTRAVAEFQRWMDGYRPGAEANHGYGTGRIESVPADPRPQWTTQLAALDAEARKESGQSFASLPRDRRQALVRAALTGERGETLPSPLAARHIALALIAHFYDSPAATDLCYEAQIGRQQCRPLAAQRMQPVALARRPR